MFADSYSYKAILTFLSTSAPAEGGSASVYLLGLTVHLSVTHTLGVGCVLGVACILGRACVLGVACIPGVACRAMLNRK